MAESLFIHGAWDLETFFFRIPPAKLICLGWKTKAQLMAMHNDEQIVSRIIDTKTRQQEYKEHPDAPGDINAMMFYVLVDLENVEEDEYEEEVRLDVSGEAYGEQVLHKSIRHFMFDQFEVYVNSAWL